MFALAFNGAVWNFPIAPDGIDVNYTARTAVTPTLTAAYVDMFGPGIGAVSINGTTGWGVGPRKRNGNGVALLRQLVSLYENYLVAAAAAADPANVQMTFADGYTGNAFLVVPDASGLRTQQSKASPLLIRFSLTLVVLRDLSGGRSAALGSQLALGALERMGSGLGDFATSNAWAAESQATTASAPALASPSFRYTVQPGDTIDQIAQAYETTRQAIMQDNGIRYAGRIVPGVVLTITPGVY